MKRLLLGLFALVMMAAPAAAQDRTKPGQYFVVPPTLVDSQWGSLLLDVNGRQIVASQPGTPSASTDYHAEDAPHTSGDVGDEVLCVRNDSMVAITNTDLDYSPIACNSAGALNVKLGSRTAGADGVNNALGQTFSDGSNFTNYAQTWNYFYNGTTWDRAAGTAANGMQVYAKTGSLDLGKAEDAAHASGDTGVLDLSVRNDSNVTLTSADLDYGAHAVSQTGQVVIKPYSATGWTYAAAASGISNTTTAVTFKAAAGAGIKNCVTGFDLETDGALGAATEVAIRDGAAGTVIWRTKLSTAGLTAGRVLVFQSPLCGTANTLMEIVTLTASVTGAVYFNAQGYTGP